MPESVRRCVAALCLAGAAAAADPPSGVAVQQAAAEAVRRSAAQQAAAVAQQQASVARQRAALGAPGVWQPPSAACPPVDSAALAAAARSAAKATGLNPDLLVTVARQESALIPCSVSPKGALGLMQLMPGTAAEAGVTDPFDPWQSMAGGAWYLKQLLDRYRGDLELALAAYNAGPAKVDAKGAVPDIPETRKYVQKVMAGSR